MTTAKKPHVAHIMSSHKYMKIVKHKKYTTKVPAGPDFATRKKCTQMSTRKHPKVKVRYHNGTYMSS